MTEAAPRRNGVLVAARSFGNNVLATARSFGNNVLVAPVRGGRLRDIDWPLGLRPIVALALGAYVIAALLVAGGGIIRSAAVLFAQNTSQVPLPRATVWLLFALVALSLTLAQAGALHMRAWVRWFVTGYVGMLLLFLGGTQVISPLGSVAVGTSVIATIALVVLVAVRGRRSFSWIEFVIIAVLIFGTITAAVGASSSAALAGFDFAPLLLTTSMALLTSLAIPATIASGAAVAELAVTSATWAAISFRDGLGRIAVIVLIVVLLVWRGFDLAPTVVAVANDPAYELVTIVGAIVFLALFAAAWWGLRRLRRSRAAATVTGVVDAQLNTSLPIAGAITPLALITPVIVIASVLGMIAPPLAEPLWGLYSVLASYEVIGGMRLLTGVALIVLAVLLARRGVASMPELFVAIGIASAVGGAIVLVGGFQLWTPASVSVVATIACVGLLLWVLVTRRATTARLTGIAVALLAAALFGNPQWLTDPLGVVLPSAAIASVLLGLTWALLTGFAIANGHSARYPRPARVMLMLANTVFATTVLAYVALSKDPGAGFNFEAMVELGQITFGTPLVACALLVAFTAVLRDRDVEPVPVAEALAEKAASK